MRVMVKRWYHSALLLGLLACIIGLPTPVAAENARMQQKQQALQAVREKIRAIGRSIEKTRAQRSGLENKLHQTEQKISTLSNQLDNLDQRIQMQHRRLAKTERDIAEVRSEIAAQRASLARQIRAAYITGRQNRMQLFLSQQNPAEIGRLLSYYDYFNRARNKRIQGGVAQIQQLTSLRDTLTRQTQALTALRGKRAGALEELQSAQSSRSQMIAKLSDRLGHGHQRMANLQADEKQLQTLIERLQNALQHSAPPPVAEPHGPFSHLRGHLPWPVSGPLLARFHTTKEHTNLLWQGIWIGAPAGAPVKAVAAGRVVYVGWMHRYGLLIIISHSGNYYTLYGHNQDAYVHAGDSVSYGQRIASAGDTGGHDRSGVYFQLRKGKTPVDPLRWLASTHG